VGADVLLLLIGMDLIHAVGTPAGLLLQGLARNRWFVHSEIVNAGFNVLLSIVLVQKIGVVGVALGTVLAHACTSSWVVPWLACRYTGLSLKRYVMEGLLQPIAAGVVTAGVVWTGVVPLFPTSNLFWLALNGGIVTLLYAVSYVALETCKRWRAASTA